MTDLRLLGNSVSPYTRKLRELLRNRRIPYQFVRAGGRESEALPPAPLPLVSYVILPDQNGELKEAMIDTTPMASGDKMLECELDGRPWVQETFVSQVKCLKWLKQRHDNRGENDKERLDNVLSGTGCEARFAE